MPAEIARTGRTHLSAVQGRIQARWWHFCLYTCGLARGTGRRSNGPNSPDERWRSLGQVALQKNATCLSNNLLAAITTASVAAFVPRAARALSCRCLDVSRRLASDARHFMHQAARHFDIKDGAKRPRIACRRIARPDIFAPSPGTIRPGLYPILRAWRQCEQLGSVCSSDTGRRSPWRFGLQGLFSYRSGLGSRAIAEIVLREKDVGVATIRRPAIPSVNGGCAPRWSSGARPANPCWVALASRDGCVVRPPSPGSDRPQQFDLMLVRTLSQVFAPAPLRAICVLLPPRPTC
jgi:hypothetical protein